MVTVLPISEYEKLLIEGQLTTSTNIDFIKNADLRVMIKKLIYEKTGTMNPNGFITIVASEDSNDYQRILGKTNPLNAVLPKPTNPVYLKLNSNTPGISISTRDLLDVENFDLTDEQTKDLLHTFFDDGDDGIRYFFVPVLSIKHVDEESYHEDLAEAVAKIKSRASSHDILYKPLNLF